MMTPDRPGVPRRSGGRCGRAGTSRAASATWTCPRRRSCGRTSSPAAARPAADPLHRQPGRADVGDDADRVQRPPGLRVERGDTVIISASRSPGTTARPRRDQPAREDRSRGAARGQRPGARLGPRLRRGAADDHRAPAAEGGDAGARRVPDAGRPRSARAARAGCRRTGSSSPRMATSSSCGRRRDHRRRGRGRRHVRRRARRGGRPRRRAARPAKARRGRRPDRRGDARRAGRRRSDGPAGAIARGFGEGAEPLLDELREEANTVLRNCSPTT